ncbi:MAG: hypothetical protein ACFB4I_10935 [Cyanophyceae cyanobacterium]
MFWTNTTPRIVLGILLGSVTVSLAPHPAAALTPLDLIQIPLNAVSGGTPEPLPNRNIDVFKENLNGNQLNLCIAPAPCSTPSAPRPSAPRPTGVAPVRGPIAPPRAVTPTPPRTVPQTAAPPSSGPVLTVPPIKLF